jgi:hypothetical protein
MSDPSNPTPLPPQRDRVNPSLESTRQDDARDREMHEDAGAAGTMAGAGLGCLGMIFLPWAMFAISVLAAIVVAMIVKWHYS